MDLIVSIFSWGICLIIGVPLALLGFFHLFLPKTAWSVYRGWGRLWGSDPEKINPNYNSGSAMRVVGLAMGICGVVICFIPKVMAYAPS
ncbi:MAG: hypothetical protein O3A82_02875 [Verrucomicrobia bacterium]|nr:hypothetical protein [Verrucomicrobiota bacterium]MDA0722856.1 hypothetical protein [Verrucomicrobiota bacterium]MDA1045853.1 hypothetical protein [Verrucomicrobiota bacterium]